MTPDIEPVVINFWYAFSRTEYAMKESIYFRGNEKRVDPDWREFAKAAHAGVMTLAKDDEELRNALDYLHNHPPRRQVVMDGRPGWIDAPVDVENANSLFEGMRCVRNNLFHGGKMSAAKFGSERDLKLIGAAYVVLIASVNSVQPVFAQFHAR